MVTQSKSRRSPPRKPPSKTAGAAEWPTNGFATIKQAAQFLAIGRTTVFRLLDEGVIPSAKFGGCRRIPWTGLWLLQTRAAKGELGVTQS